MTAALHAVLAAILAVDVVGCSRLMGEDEANGATPLSQSQERQLLACRYLHD
jgi:hypothetical protein